MKRFLLVSDPRGARGRLADPSRGCTYGSSLTRSSSFPVKKKARGVGGGGGGKQNDGLTLYMMAETFPSPVAKRSKLYCTLYQKKVFAGLLWEEEEGEEESQ